MTRFKRLQALYDKFGSSDYIGEPVSITEHSLQAAALAYNSFNDGDRDNEVVVAALLHDIGHVLGLEAGQALRMGGCGIQNHENIGAHFTRKLGFRERISRLISNHVSAKRYLCYKHHEYHEQLSEASKTTLVYQGGPMCEQEAFAYEQDPDFQVYLCMRRWDEAAKVANMQVSPLSFYQSLIETLCDYGSPCPDIGCISNSYVLSQSQLDFYKVNGYLKITNFFNFLMPTVTVESVRCWVSEISSWAETDEAEKGTEKGQSSSGRSSLLVHFEAGIADPTGLTGQTDLGRG